MKQSIHRESILISLVLVVVMVLMHTACSQAQEPAPTTTSTPVAKASTQKPAAGTPANARSKSRTNALRMPQKPTPARTPKRTEGPIIEILPALLDMGTVPRDVLATAKFTIYNRGTEELKLTKDPKPSCGCTSATVGTKVIAPGGQTELTAILDLKKVHGFSTTKSVQIFSNDPDNARKIVRFKVDIEPEYVLEPNELDFGEVAKGQEVTKHIILRQTGKQKFTLTKVRAPSNYPALRFTFEQRPKDQWLQPGYCEYDITATLSPEAPPGRFNERFFVTTDLKHLANVSFTAKGSIKAFYKVKTASSLRREALVGNIRHGETKEKVVTITADRPIEIKDVSIVLKYPLPDAPNPLTAEVVAGAGPNEKFINLTAAKDLPAKRSRSVVGVISWTIVGNGQKFRERVSLRGVVSPPLKDRKTTQKYPSVGQKPRTVPQTKPRPATPRRSTKPRVSAEKSKP